MLQQIQFWKLVVNVVNDDRSALLVCEREEGDVAVLQEIPFTRFSAQAGEVVFPEWSSATTI